MPSSHPARKLLCGNRLYKVEAGGISGAYSRNVLCYRRIARKPSIHDHLGHSEACAPLSALGRHFELRWSQLGPIRHLLEADDIVSPSLLQCQSLLLHSQNDGAYDIESGQDSTIRRLLINVYVSGQWCTFRDCFCGVSACALRAPHDRPSLNTGGGMRWHRHSTLDNDLSGSHTESHINLPPQSQLSAYPHQHCPIIR